MKFTTGDRAGRYEILSLLGKGGMGEVYLARDTELHRPVALKLLIKTDDAERVRRFRQEARSISALNHPNILTVHDIGEHENVHFIVTEYIKGETLRQQIEGAELDLAAALRIAIQIGTALAAAHQAGIVHRDIKPENVMVLPDGHVKVLDFGVAKLLNEQGGILPTSQDSTISQIATHPGLMVGTINYMSPEQLRGKPVDERTDIWSLGVVFYEMVTHRHPFAGESTSDVIAGVIGRQLPPMSELEPEVPAPLYQIIARGLQKERTERFASAREFVEELNEALLQLTSGGVAKWSSTNPEQSSPENGGGPTNPTPSGSAISPTPDPSPIAGPRFGYAKIFGAAAVLLLLLGGLAIYWIRTRSPRRINGPAIVKPLGASNNLLNATISPDGVYYVYSQSERGMQSLSIGQINGSGETKLILPDSVSYAGLTYTPDGQRIYFITFDQKTNTTSGKLFSIGLTPGLPQPILENVDSAVTFAPDGRRLAFIRSLPETKTDQLIVAKSDGSDVQILAQSDSGNFYSATSREAPSWSPDGANIVCPAGFHEVTGEFMTLVSINVETGRETRVTSRQWSRIGRTWWTPDGSAILFSAKELGSDRFEIFRLSYPGDELTKVTHDLVDYSNFSVNRDASLMLAVAAIENCSVYVTPDRTTERATALTKGKYDGLAGFDWMPDGGIVYSSRANANTDLWIKRPEETGPPRPLTSDPAADEYPSVSPDGETIVYASTRENISHLWRINPNTGGPTQLTNGSGERFPHITADGKFVIYAAGKDKFRVIWKIPLEGGAPIQLTKQLSNWPAVSPDGKWIAFLTKEDSTAEPVRLGIVSIDGGEMGLSFPTAEGAAGSPGFEPALTWSPDSQGVMYVATKEGVSNIWEQRLDGRPRKQWTDFASELIYCFGWSKDGKRLAYSRGAKSRALSQITNF
jgi:serine/threonine protein kinase